MKTITQHYLDGIEEGREVFQREGLEYAAQHIENLRSEIKRGFPASHPVGQMLRGELDFWRNQLKGSATRKIGQAMLDAVKHRRYWHSHNTQVIPELRQDGKPLACVLLNDLHFATVGYRPASVDEPGSWYVPSNLSVSLAGWNTPMMRSRIRALLSLYPGYIIYTQRGDCYILDRNTGRKNVFVRNTEWVSIPFSE